ncbi:MAG TPA: adenylate/guanylate cyclase domain-containing protein [Leptospiraceae bacterium]|nr:adenylate/guanylate cyclase domain-containing protein [Leptospiraceae bacterium]HRG74180.1 adenylate/guanylate cyclase domain-containing protein [Leptospiraceae bacterium]
MKLLEKIKTNLNRKLMSSSVLKVLEEEELNGAVLANRFRYLFLILIASGGVFNLAGIKDAQAQFKGSIIYGTGFLLYLIITIFHTSILRHCKDKSKIHRIGLMTTISDFAILTGMMLSWYELESADNFNYFLKNPSFIYFLFPFILALIQIRLSLVIVSIIAFIFIHFTSIMYGVYLGVPTSVDWKLYILGDQIYMSDLLMARPIAYSSLALAVGFSIYRTIFMVKRIGTIEAEKKSLSKYFSPEIVEEITKNPEVLNQGKRQEVTILFQDIRNFTKMSEGMNPDELAEFLNEFRMRMTNVVFANGGTLDKYIGDAIMATFGTPNMTPNDTVNAVNTGLQMLSSLSEWNLIRKKQSKEEIKIGIGLHCGEVFAGSVGFAGRMEYTVIGDAVNTASRIESLCKQFHAEFLISEEVYQKVKQTIQVETLPLIEVKGKEKLLQVYKVIS